MSRLNRKRPTCLCNDLILDAFQAAIQRHASELNGMGILKASGTIYQCARDETIKQEKRIASSSPCATCFDTVAFNIQQAGYCQDEKLPPRTTAPDCPRRELAKAPRPSCCQIPAVE